MMDQAGGIDFLVDEITRRVQARLGSRSTNSCDGVGPDCDTCRGCHVKRPEQVRELIGLGAERLAAGVGHDAPDASIAGIIDHTLLKPDATKDELRELCDEARRYNFATVCVNPTNVRYCASLLQGCHTKPIAVVGFPLGAQTPNAKAFESREAVRHGAQEIDMVINIGALKSKQYDLVLEDISTVVGAAAPKPVKVILETASLNDEDKVIACVLSKVGGAAFVKTSTGFGAGGATADDVALMRRVVGPDMGVKASGGIRNREVADAMVTAGATRLGASASVGIVTEKLESKRSGRRSPSRSSGGY